MISFRLCVAVNSSFWRDNVEILAIWLVLFRVRIRFYLGTLWKNIYGNLIRWIEPNWKGSNHQTVAKFQQPKKKKYEPSSLSTQSAWTICWRVKWVTVQSKWAEQARLICHVLIRCFNINVAWNTLFVLTNSLETLKDIERLSPLKLTILQRFRSVSHDWKLMMLWLL